MYHAYTLLVMASIIASAPTYASGSNPRGLMAPLLVESRRALKPTLQNMFISRSCLSYGHSCWGAHGKRSSSGVELVPASRQDRLTNFLLSQQQRSRQHPEEPEEVVVMGQPQLSLYQILDQLPGNYQGMNPINN